MLALEAEMLVFCVLYKGHTSYRHTDPFLSFIFFKSNQTMLPFWSQTCGHLLIFLTCILYVMFRLWYTSISLKDDSKIIPFKKGTLPLQAQLQDAKRRWEELQNFLHTVNAEREKIQASNQGDSK